MQKLLFHFPRVTINAPVPGIALNYELEVYIVLESYDAAYPRSSCITISTENTRLYVSLDLDTRTEYYDCSIYRRNQWLALVETHRQVLEGYRWLRSMNRRTGLRPLATISNRPINRNFPFPKFGGPPEHHFKFPSVFNETRGDPQAGTLCTY